ncbi:uncharacterized protein G2W53_003819 [Senna tora]|uniref:Uncharacterized protein n=1 Tax=Senna tora TaxID=362788 RepID=A0A834XAT2_9FABA|nr:uncharacterized protein G2W53_003819 [Senna tora]
MPKLILNEKSRLNFKGIQEALVKRGVAKVNQTDRIALYLGIKVHFMLEWDS